MASSASLIAGSGENPPMPVFATTRWQGTTMGVGFRDIARPTTRGAVPTEMAISLYVAVLPQGISRTAR